MQLTLNHNDLTKALCAYLQAQGMTAFDPSVVTVEFAFKRGTKELLATLDTDAPAPAAVVPVTAAAAVASAVVETVQLVEELEAPVAAAEPEQAPVVEAQPEAAVAPVAEEDNLFD